MFRQAKSLEQAFDLLRRKINDFGFVDIIYGWSEFVHIDRVSEGVTFLTTLDKGLVDSYVEKHASDDDYYAIQCQFSMAPMIWNDPAILAKMTPNQLRCNDWLAREGVEVGVTVPLGPGRNYGFGGIGLNADPSVSFSEIDHHWSQHGRFVQQISLSFHHAIHREGFLSPNFVLTSRERDFLCWVMRGYSREVIAHNMGVTTNQLDKWVKSTKKKLNARSVVHAASKAFIQGAISP